MIAASGTIYQYHPPILPRLGRLAGLALLTLSLATIIFLFTPIALAELRYVLSKYDQQPLAQETTKTGLSFDTIAVQNEARQLGLSSYFSVFVPKINARADIIPNVSTQDETEYQRALTKGVAHARGTYFPGQGKNIFLFAHSTDSPLNFSRYNAVFYLLRKLENGDRITVFFLDKKYEYEVVQKVIAEPDDTSWIYRDFGSETLILQTCDPPGTTWRRLLVIAKPVR